MNQLFRKRTVQEGHELLSAVTPVPPVLCLKKVIVSMLFAMTLFPAAAYNVKEQENSRPETQNERYC